MTTNLTKSGHIIDNSVIGIDKIELLKNGYKVCNQCIHNKIKHISQFDDELKSCRRCLENRRKKINCACGGRYTVGGKTSHINTKMHQKYEFDNDNL